MKEFNTDNNDRQPQHATGESKYTPLDLSEYSDYLQRHHKRGFFQCPVCSGKLGISRSNGEKFTCFSGCTRSDIRKAVLAASCENTHSAEWEQRRAAKEQERLEAERIRIASLKSSSERHKDWLDITGKLQLSDRHRQDMLDRGWTPELIKLSNARSTSRGRVIPITTAEGLMVGSQVIGETKTWYGAAEANRLLETDELPLAVIQPLNPYQTIDKSGRLTGYIAYTESVCDKPWLCAQLRNYITIGSSNIGSQPKDLERSIDTIKTRQGWDEVKHVLMADGGSVLNKGVMLTYRKLNAQIEALGGELQVLWYEQITKDCGDIDEISPNTPTRLISWHEFEQIATSQQWRMMSILKCFRKSRQPKSVPAPLPTPVPHSIDRIYTNTTELESICSNAIETGIKYVLDLSVTGSGKSTTSASIRNVGGIDRYFYITDTHRNPTTAAVETSFTDISSRHNGLYINPHKLTPLGHPYLQTTQPPAEKLEMTAGNCHLADLHNSLRGKGYEIDGDDNPICMTCPLVGACTHSSGIGFGYKFKRRSALAEGRLRCSPSSLPHPNGFDYQDSLSIWDDTRIKYSNEIVATTNDFDQTLAQLSTANPKLLVQLQPLTAKLRAMFEGERRAKFGFSHAEIMDGVTIPDVDSLLATIREILTPDLSELIDAPDGIDTTGMSAKDKKKWRSSIVNVNRSFRGQTKRSNINSIESMPSNWLVRLLETIVTGKGYFRFDRGALVVTIPDDYHRSIVRVSKLNLFLDATHNREDLALELGVTPAEILVISQPVPTYENLKISLVTGMGNPTKDRRDSMQDRLDALGQALRDRHHGNIAIIDKVRSPDSGLWYRDSRGTNAYKDCEALVLIGSPVPNLGSLSAQFSILVGRQIAPTSDDPEFKAYINRQIVAETVQGVGRLRAQHHPDKQLTIYWVCERVDLPVDDVVAAYPNCQHDRVAAIDICLQTGTITQQLHHKVAQTLLKFGAMTRDKLANLTNLSPAALTKYFSQLGHNFKTGSHLLLKALYSKRDLFKSTTDELPNSILADWENLNVADVVELVQEVLRNPDATVLEKAETVVAVVESLPPRQLRGLFVRLGEVLTLQLIDLIRLSLVNDLEVAA